MKALDVTEENLNDAIRQIEETYQILIPPRNEINKWIKHAAEYSTSFMFKSATSSVMKSHAFVHYGLKEISPVCHKAISHKQEVKMQVLVTNLPLPPSKNYMFTSNSFSLSIL